MKEIWINLELYFESYEFFNFSEFIFDLNLFKTIKRRLKRGLLFARDPCRCDVACKATWQSHADPRKRLRGTKVTCAIFIFTRII